MAEPSAPSSARGGWSRRVCASFSSICGGGRGVRDGVVGGLSRGGDRGAHLVVGLDLAQVLHAEVGGSRALRRLLQHQRLWDGGRVLGELAAPSHPWLPAPAAPRSWEPQLLEFPISRSPNPGEPQSQGSPNPQPQWCWCVTPWCHRNAPHCTPGSIPGCLGSLGVPPAPRGVPVCAG